jgi:hypothetical protein
MRKGEALPGTGTVNDTVNDTVKRHSERLVGMVMMVVVESRLCRKTAVVLHAEDAWA